MSLGCSLSIQLYQTASMAQTQALSQQIKLMFADLDKGIRDVKWNYLLQNNEDFHQTTAKTISLSLIAFRNMYMKLLFYPWFLLRTRWAADMSLLSCFFLFIYTLNKTDLKCERVESDTVRGQDFNQIHVTPSDMQDFTSLHSDQRRWVSQSSPCNMLSVLTAVHRLIYSTCTL